MADLNDYPDQDAGAAGDPDAAVNDDDVSGAEDEVAAEVDAGAFDAEPDAGAVIGSRLMSRAMSRIRVMTARKKAAIAAAQRRVKGRFERRVADNANRVVPMSALAVADAASVTFTYQAPEKARFLGFSMTETVANNFGATALSLGSDRLIEAQGVTGGSGTASSASLANWTPNALSRKAGFANGRLIEGNTQMVLTVINNSGAAANFRASMSLHVIGKYCRG